MSKPKGRMVACLSTRKHERASALLLAIFFMMMLSLIATAFMVMVPAELQAAGRYQRDTHSYYAADAGIADGILYLQWTASLQNPTYPLGLKDPNFAVTGNQTITGNLTSDGKWFYNTTITPKDSGGISYFRLQSVAYNQDMMSGASFLRHRTISVDVLQESFASKLYFVDVLPSDIWLNLASFSLDGDYHTNDKLLVYAPSGFNWNSGSATFQGDVSFNSTVSPPGHGYVDGVKYIDFGDQGRVPFNITNGSNYGKPIAGRYERIVQGGKAQLEDGAKTETMPPNTVSLGSAAWGSSAPTTSLTHTNTSHISGRSSSANIHVNPTDDGSGYKDLNSGIYIEGEVSQMTLSVVNGNSVVTVEQSNGSNSKKYANVTYVGEDGAITIPANSTTPANINGVIHTTNVTLTNTTNGGKGFTVIRDCTGNQTTANGGGPSSGGNKVLGNTYQVFDKMSNGVIYCTGDIDGLRGTNKYRKTIAVKEDTGSSTADDHAVYINGDLLREDVDNSHSGVGVKPSIGQTRDQLGVIAYKVVLRSKKGSNNSSNFEDGSNKEEPAFQGSAAGTPESFPRGMWPRRNATNSSNPLKLYASFFCGRADDPRSGDGVNGGGFGSEDYNDSSYGEGEFRIYGSIVEGVRQIKGLIDTSGNSYKYIFDPNLKNGYAPPFFPGLSTFRVVSWKEESLYNY